MARSSSKDTHTTQRRVARSPEARENQLIALATDLVEKRLIEGTASSQETTHFLKLATTKSKLELRKLELENELTEAKTEAVKSQARMEELYIKAINAMKKYSGQGGDDDQNEY